MKILAIMGSSHMNGNGATALDCVLKGAQDAGNECVRYDLYKSEIRNCLGCRKCIKNGGICVLKDDYEEMFEHIKTADLVIINSPIYINQINGLTKTFLDRCYPLTDEKHKPRFGKRNVMLLCTYAVPIPFIFSKYIRYTGKSLKAMGLINKKNIIIPGCTTNEYVKNNEKLLNKLRKIGQQIH